MAVTVAITDSTFDYNRNQSLHKCYATITFDSSYPTGGEAADFTATAIMTGSGGAFTTINEVHTTNMSTAVAQAGYVVAYDKAAALFQVYEAGADGAALDEVANTTDLSALLIAVIVTGV